MSLINNGKITYRDYIDEELPKCPKCKHDVRIINNFFKCDNCGLEFKVTYEILYDPDVKCDCWEPGHWYLGADYGTCKGTREQEPCRCNGYKKDCDFYKKEWYNK